MRRPISCPSWVIILLVLTILSCNKNDIQPTFEKPGNEYTELISIHLSGRLLNESMEPVGGAIIRSGTQVTLSDINGQFNFNTLEVNPKGAMIEINKDGYFRAYQTIDVLPESEQYTEINLKSKTDDYQFNAASGTQYTLGLNGQLIFPPAAIVDKINHQNYTGIVQLSSFGISREDKRFFQYLPAIKGIDQANKEVVILPVSIVNTILSGASGQSLQIAPGKFVTIHFPIPAADLSHAPTSISLWSYDEIKGIFTEEGKAIKIGNYYEGNVSHFSIWACGLGVPAISAQSNITDLKGNGLAYAKVQLVNAGNQQIISPVYRADFSGFVNFQAPANVQLELRVLNDCGEIIANKKINTGSTKLWVGKIQTVIDGTVTTLISGLVENCKKGKVFSGYVTLDIEGRNYKALIDDGKFSLQLSRCSATTAKANLKAIDNAGNQESSPISFDIKTGNQDLGTLSTCDKGNNQFVSYSINGTNYLLQAPGDSLVQISGQSNKTTIYCYGKNDWSKPEFSFTFSGSGKPGQFPVTALNINQPSQAFVPSGNIAVEITNYGMPGEYITGKCIGQVKSPSFTQALPFSFNFKILRQY